jgi:2-polyprenyl-3-methyl-5-hydroxy-6-metoxy-1,4-benzoquinol methylase
MFTLFDVNGKETDSYHIAYRIFEILLEELKFHAFSRRYLTAHDFELLAQYYSALMRTPNASYLGYCFAQRLKNLVRCIGKYRDVMPRVLDCGCGMGSESIACAIIGAKVVGIDLDKERIDVAKKRLSYYRSKFDVNLDVDFLCREILKYESNVKFDILHAKEFISHVWSLPAFLKFARNVLREKGYLIVSDANLFNPYIAFRAHLDHRTALFTAVCEPETGIKIPYAVERLFSPRYVAKVFIQQGFKPISISIFGYFPSIPRRLLNVVVKLEEIMSNIPVGTAYEITGVKMG